MDKTKLSPKKSYVAGKHNKDAENRLTIKTLTAAAVPLTRRELSQKTGLEITSLCRVLHKLVYNSNLVQISHYAPCKLTGKKVMHFMIKNDKEKV